MAALCTELQTALERFFFAGLRRPVVGKVLHMKWLEGELHGFHRVAIDTWPGDVKYSVKRVTVSDIAKRARAA